MPRCVAHRRLSPCGDAIHAAAKNFHLDSNAAAHDPCGAFAPPGRGSNNLPVPRTPISLAIFLHEVGHHVIGFDRYRRRCEEEFHAWAWALRKMRSLGVAPDARVHRRVELSMRYAVGKAMRRGLKDLPPPLEQFLPQAA